MVEIIKLLPAQLAEFMAYVRWNHSFPEHEASNLPDQAYLENWLSQPHHHVFLALKEGQVIGGLTAFGLSMYHEAKAELFVYEVDVDQAHRQEGIGTRLLEACLQFAQSNGFSYVFLGTEIDNQPARRLYLKAGGKEELIAWYVWE